MESLTKTGASSHLGDGEVPDKPAKNPRASQAEMTARTKEVIKYLDKNEGGDLYALAEALSLTHPQVLTLLSNLMKDGRIVRAGRVGRRITYKLASNKQAEVQPAPAAEAVHLPSVDLPFQIGEHLEVVGIHVTSDGVKVDLQDPAVAVLGEGQKTLTLVA